MVIPQVSQFVYLIGFSFLVNGVLSQPNIIFPKDSIVEKTADYVISRPNGIYVKDLVEKRGPIDLSSNRSFQVHLAEREGFTGFRSAFQWKVGNRTVNNYGIHNGLQFSVVNGVNPNNTILGDIEIYSNGSQIGINFSLDSKSKSGAVFNCSKNFPLNSGGLACCNANFSLISSAIYFIDVEINENNNTISAFISQPQSNLSEIKNSTLPRVLIGEIKWSNKLKNLMPVYYWIWNQYKTCDLSSEISTYNYLPQSYNKQKRQRGRYTLGVLNLSKMCGPINSLALEDMTSVVYISRPKPVIQIN